MRMYYIDFQYVPRYRRCFRLERRQNPVTRDVGYLRNLPILRLFPGFHLYHAREEPAALDYLAVSKFQAGILSACSPLSVH
jgi:hypothetical protein